MVLCVQWICLLGLQAVDWTSGCSVGFWATLPVNFGGRCLSSRSCPCFLAAGWLAIFVVLSSVVGVLLAHFVLGCFRQSCGTLGLLDTEQSLVTWGPAVSLRSIGFCRWPQRWLGLLALGWCIRVGEASVPGPDSSSCGSHERTFQIGVCNPNGLVDKAMFFTDMEEDLWCVSETHLSQAGRRSFLKMMQRHAKQYTSFQFGHDVLPRSEVSDVGRWTGVGVLSRWPTCRLDHDWSPLLHATGRICVNTSFIHGHWISGCVIYAPPTGQTHGNAKQTADAILRVGLDRVLQLAGPRYLSGDWNHDHHRLETVGILRQLGWVDLQDLNLSRWGVAPQATCRGKTRRDFLFLSPELACMFRSCSLYTWSWTDHCVLVGTFACSSLDLERLPWPRPMLLSGLVFKLDLRVLPFRSLRRMMCHNAMLIFGSTLRTLFVWKLPVVVNPYLTGVLVVVKERGLVLPPFKSLHCGLGVLVMSVLRSWGFHMFIVCGFVSFVGLNRSAVWFDMGSTAGMLWSIVPSFGLQSSMPMDFVMDFLLGGLLKVMLGLLDFSFLSFRLCTQLHRGSLMPFRKLLVTLNLT